MLTIDNTAYSYAQPVICARAVNTWVFFMNISRSTYTFLNNNTSQNLHAIFRMFMEDNEIKMLVMFD